MPCRCIQVKHQLDEVLAITLVFMEGNQMKNITYLLLMLLFATFVKPIFASDLTKLYPQQMVETKNLYSLAYDYFRGPNSLAPGETLTPEMVKSPKRQQAFYKMWQLLGLAIDDGQDISFMAEFGLSKIKGAYFVDYKKYPQWADISALFMSLDTKAEVKQSTYYLHKKGFSNKGLEVLRAHIARFNPNEAAEMLELKLLSTYKENLNLNNRQSSQTTSELLHLHESIKRKKHFSWNQWAVKLMNKLTLHDQRVLLDRLQGQLGSMAIGKLAITEEYLHSYSKEILSGKALTDINNQLTKYREKYIKE